MNTPWAPGYTIGAGGLLFWAAGLAPSKDAVWTAVHELGAPPPCGSTHDNPNFELDVH